MPDPRFGEARLRHINDIADKTATQVLDAERLQPIRSTYAASLLCADDWSVKAFALAETAARKYDDYLGRRHPPPGSRD